MKVKHILEWASERREKEYMFFLLEWVIEVMVRSRV